MPSAFGKIILLGEHAVVHGRPAIAAALPRGARAEADRAGPGRRLLVPAWGVDVDGADPSDLGRAFAAVLSALSLEAEPVRVVAEPLIPAGGGLGCSAAMGVAVARAVAAAHGRALSTAEASDAALAWEKVIHGNPSGIDNAIAAGGGIGVYRRGEPLRPLRLPAPLPIAVGDTGTAGSTKQMVESVARQRERKPESVEKVFDGIGALVTNGVTALERGERRRLGELFDLAQALLAALFVSTSEIEALCALARGAGAFGCKLTGGGGGGCVIAVADRPDDVVEAWRRAGYTGFAAEVGGS